MPPEICFNCISAVRSGRDFEQPQVLLGPEPRERGVAEAGRGDGFDEQLRHLFRGVGVDLAIHADDAAESRDRIGLERAQDRRRAGRPPVAVPQGLVCLMMAQAGAANSCASVPGGFEIDEVVVAELLAVQLAGVGDAGCVPSL